jgi:hypothetical protein
VTKGETRALIGWADVYSQNRVLAHGFVLKSVVFELISNEIGRAKH